MDPLSDLRWVWRLVIGSCRVVFWILGTIWDGAVALVRGVVFLMRLPAFRAETIRCPRGHDVPTYDVWQCTTCPATFEGYVFGKCPACRMTAAWTPCPACQLPARHPSGR